MKFIDFSQNYQRLFRFDEINFLFADMWMDSYQKRYALDLTLAENTTMYMPAARIRENLEEGVAFFQDQARFDTYRREYEAFIPTFPEYFNEHIKDKKSLTRGDVAGFLKISAQVFDYFYKTEFFFLDEVYKLYDSNPNVRANLDTHYKLKERARVENLNDGFFGEQSYQFSMLRILAGQSDVEFRDLFVYSVDEVLALFEGARTSREVLAERKIARIIKTTPTSKEYLFGEEAKKEILEFREQTGDVIPYGTDTLKGTPANKGVVRGKIKIIVSNMETYDHIEKEFEKMEKGDVLVAETTSPEFMPALRKAGAVLADQGGLLSHAAVVSREFGVPCIVAMKYATKVFKDGDIVEVDGGKGVVTVIKRAP